MSNCFGLIKCTIVPPPFLFHPVLPYRFGGKLTYPLCRTCTEQEIDLPLHRKRAKCSHTDEERALTGTWCTLEIKVALDIEYRIIRVHEVWKFQCAEHSLFKCYVNTWLQLKTEASGWPDKCQEYINNYGQMEGIRLELSKNPGLYSLAKLMMNSLRGKFGQRKNLMKVQAFYDPNPFHLIMDTDQHTVRYMSYLDKH